MRRLMARVLIALVGFALAGWTLAGCAAPADDARATSSTPAPSASATRTVDDVGAVRAPVVVGEVEISDSSPESLAALRPEPPRRLVVEALGIDMPVTEVGLEGDGAMEIPESAQTAGWYRYGPAPGGDRGSAVLAAHVDDARIGLGPFSRLERISEGERIVVTLADGDALTYEVAGVERTSKREVDMDLVFDRTGESRLVLVTCGGRFDWDAGHYEDNVVVYATPIDAPAG
ncbi:MAG: class F sortase [Demequina sp.]